MSGLIAIARWDGGQVDVDRLEPMIEALGHRAWHGVDRWRSPDGAMAAAHLHAWTTPEEIGERQPLILDGVAFLWDGRLDDRAGLAAALGLGAADARARSDAMLAALAYQRWGEAMAERLRGPFALLALDPARGRVFMARDPVGRRSLCYADLGRDGVGAGAWTGTGTGLAIASEPAALLAHPGVGDEIDATWLARYFALRPVGDGRTIFAAVREVGAGEAVTAGRAVGSEVETGDERPRARRFWSPGSLAEIRYRRDDDYAEHWLELMRQATRRRMRAPSAPGVLMSGGLDSTPVAALAAEARLASGGGTGLPTYSYAFERFADSDERRFIEAMRARWDLCARVVVADEALPIRGLRAWARDPNGPEDNLFRPQMDLVLGRAGQDGVAVLLAGYWGDRHYLGAEWWLRDLVRRGRFIEAAIEVARHARRNGPLRVAQSASVRRLVVGGRQRPGRSSARTTDVDSPPWLTDAAAALLRDAPAWNPRPELDAALRPEQARALLGAEPAWGGRSDGYAVARFGLEIREPFSDLDVIDFSLRVPAYQLYHRGDLKSIARRAMRGLLPEAVRTRSDKTGYAAFVRAGARAEAATIERLLQPRGAPWAPYVRAEWVAAGTLGAGADARHELVRWRCAAVAAWVEGVRGPREAGPAHRAI